MKNRKFPTNADFPDFCVKTPDYGGAMSNKPEITRLSLHADVLNITITIEIVDGSPEENITIPLPRTSEGRREAIEFVDD